MLRNCSWLTLTMDMNSGVLGESSVFVWPKRPSLPFQFYVDFIWHSFSAVIITMSTRGGDFIGHFSNEGYTTPYRNPADPNIDFNSS